MSEIYVTLYERIVFRYSLSLTRLIQQDTYPSSLENLATGSFITSLYTTRALIFFISGSFVSLNWLHSFCECYNDALPQFPADAF
jgi:hypothetical protein